MVAPIAIAPPFEDDMCCVDVSKSNVSEFIVKEVPAASNLIKLVAEPKIKKSPVPSI